MFETEFKICFKIENHYVEEMAKRAYDSNSKGPCNKFALDLTADFGLCKCGFNKVEHDKREMVKALLGEDCSNAVSSLGLENESANKRCPVPSNYDKTLARNSPVTPVAASSTVLEAKLR